MICAASSRIGSVRRSSRERRCTRLGFISHREGGGFTISRPAGYLLRTVINVAADQRRGASRLARRSEIAMALDLPDKSPGPAECVEARQEIAALEQALQELTPRRRQILLASRIEGTPMRQIAERLGVSQRLVEMELKHALDHCANRLDRKVTRRLVPGLAKRLESRSGG